MVPNQVSYRLFNPRGFFGQVFFFFFFFFWPPSDSSICVNCRCLLFYAEYFDLVLGCSFLLMSFNARWS